jgi:hypothetical protein
MTGPICQAAPELWFDDDPTDAIDACCKCPLITPCLKTAMAREGTLTAQHRYGVWGGLTPEQRETLAIADHRNHHPLHAKTG